MVHRHCRRFLDDIVNAVLSFILSLGSWLKICRRCRSLTLLSTQLMQNTDVLALSLSLSVWSISLSMTCISTLLAAYKLFFFHQHLEQEDIRSVHTRDNFVKASHIDLVHPKAPFDEEALQGNSPFEDNSLSLCLSLCDDDTSGCEGH